MVLKCEYYGQTEDSFPCWYVTCAVFFFCFFVSWLCKGTGCSHLAIICIFKAIRCFSCLFFPSFLITVALGEVVALVQDHVRSKFVCFGERKRIEIDCHHQPACAIIPFPLWIRWHRRHGYQSSRLLGIACGSITSGASACLPCRDGKKGCLSFPIISSSSACISSLVKALIGFTYNVP